MAPLKGELAAKLTEGSGLAFGQALRRKAQIPGFPNIRAWIPPMAEAFLPKSRTPQTRLSPGQLPFQESLSVVRIRPSFLVPPACAAPHQSGLRPASITFYGIAATGSYQDFDSLRDAPPVGKLSETPLAFFARLR